MSSRRIRRGFTLIEMLVVIGIIVMAMTLAIPAIRSLTGSRSQEATQNMVTTALGSARARAMAMQRVTGIMFCVDSSTDRVNCAMVEETPQEPTDPTDVTITYLNLVQDVDPITLPAGLRVFAMKDTLSPQLNPSNRFQEYFTGRYMGYDSPGANTPPAAQDPTVLCAPGGVILFDSTGRLCFKTYGWRLNAPASGASPAQLTSLGTLIYGTAGAVTQDWPRTAPYPFLYSSTGFVIVDRETFQGVATPAGNLTDWNQPPNQKTMDDWLDTNATPIFVNRYDGTMITP